MSHISSASSAASLYATLFPTKQIQQNPTAQALTSLNTALQSGSVTDAQTALTNLQNTFSTSGNSSTTDPFGDNTQANSAYNSLVSDIGAGDLTDAQTSLGNLQTALKSHHGGHHHGAKPESTSDTTDTSSSSDPDGTSGNYINVTV